MSFLSNIFKPLRCAGLTVLLLGALSAAQAGTVTGTVTNGTTGKPAAGIEVILIQLQGGMQPVANTKTDADGHYKFDNPNLGTAPMLLRAVYRGVFYHEPATPGKTTVDMQVFEPTDKPGSFAVTAHAIILQPQGDGLLVGEEFNIQNKTQPPLAYYKADGSFMFNVPDDAKLSDVSAVSAQGMPVIQNPIQKSKNEEAITYAFRPGDSGVRISYNVPYPGNQTKLSFVSPYNAQRLAIFVPPTMQVSSDGFTPAGQEQGFNVYIRDNVAANTPFQVAVSGTAPPPAADNGAAGAGAQGDASQDPSVNSRASDAPVATTTAMPARLDSIKWVIVAGFAALFALGLIFVWRRPEYLGAAPAGQAAPQAGSHPAMPLANAAPPTMGSVDEAVRGSLDILKDTLFRLELRHEAGTIAEDEYARERARIQSQLRELVKG